MSYALFDLQTGNYMATGYGANSLDELKDAILSYVSVDYDEQDDDWKSIQKLSVDELCEMWEFSIEQGEFIAEHIF